MQDKATDGELVQRTLAGGQAAFRQLVARYQDMVFTVALRIVGRREDAEEVAQDTFMKVYANLHSWQGRAKFSTWLYSIAYNTALTKLRLQKPASAMFDEKIANASGQSADAVYNEAEKTFTAEYVSGAINMLGPEDAAIITLFYLGEQSIEEIALALGIEPNAAKVRLHRARRKLKEKMEGFR